MVAGGKALDFGKLNMATADFEVLVSPTVSLLANDAAVERTGDY